MRRRGGNVGEAPALSDRRRGEGSRRLRRCTFIAGLAALQVALAACRSQPAGDLDFAPRPVRELERWDVEREGRAIGRLVLLEIEDPAGGIRFYRVESLEGQWLGFVDLQGRVYQRVPFTMAEVYRGMHTMSEALDLLIGGRGGYAFVLRTHRGRAVEAGTRRSGARMLIREATEGR